MMPTREEIKLTWKVLFKLGHSKDRQHDLPQVKVVLSTLDLLGMPVATEVVAGNRAEAAEI